MAQDKPVIKLNWRRITNFLVIAPLITVLIIVLIILLSTGVLSITGIWNTILLQPMLNLLVLMSRYFLGSFGIAILVLTIILRLLILPATLRQFRSSKAIQELQPRIKELQKQYPTDKQRQGQELKILYQEAGVNPFGCVFPLLLQWPIWLALYQSVVQALAYTPENLVGLSKQLYSPSLLQNTVPLNHHFLWLDLTRGNIVMAILTAASLWVLQKMASRPDTEAQNQWISRVMLWGMPLLFGFFAFTLPSGLSLYWVASNIISVIIQYRITGWGTLKMPSLAFLRRSTPQPGHNPSAKARGTTSVAKKAGKSATARQGSAKAVSAGSEKKQAATGDISPPEKKADPEEPGDEHKD